MCCFSAGPVHIWTLILSADLASHAQPAACWQHFTRQHNPICMVQILRAYLEQFFCQELVATHRPGPRPLPGTNNLTLPSSCNPLDYASVIAALPELDSPALFGLPANVNRAVGRARGIAVTAQLKHITASQVTGRGHLPQIAQRIC